MCSIDGCKNDVLARGYCRKHYLRWYKTGDPNKTIKQRVIKGVEHPNYKHGLHSHPYYTIWSKIIDRCRNPKNPAYSYYGGKGVIVCERWSGPCGLSNFIADMGERPKGTSIDRIDSNGGYSPDNCRWADHKTQGRNRSFCKLDMEKAKEIRSIKRRDRNGHGDGMTLEEIAKIYNVSRATIKKVVSNKYWS